MPSMLRVVSTTMDEMAASVGDRETKLDVLTYAGVLAPFLKDILSQY